VHLPADTVDLGTDTTGNYVAGVTAGTGVTVTGSGFEGATPTVAIGQSVATSATPQFAGLTSTGTTATSVLTVDGIEIDTTGASANQVLQYNGTKFVPATVSGGIPDTIFDAKGDLIAASAPDTAARLPVGTNGQFLVANSVTSTGLEWQTISVMPNFEDDQNILANQVFS